MNKDREFYLANYDLDELRRMLRDAEDRSTRAYTMEDSLRDMYAIQEIGAAISIINHPHP